MKMLKLILPAVVSFALFTSCGETVTADDTAKHECTDECSEKCKKMGCDENCEGQCEHKASEEGHTCDSKCEKGCCAEKMVDTEPAESEIIEDVKQVNEDAAPDSGAVKE